MRLGGVCVFMDDLFIYWPVYEFRQNRKFNICKDYSIGRNVEYGELQIQDQKCHFIEKEQGIKTLKYQRRPTQTKRFI